MKELETKVQGLTLVDIASNPNAVDEEVLGASLEVIQSMSKQLREFKGNIEANLINRMKQSNATKLMFIDAMGNERTATLKAGKVSQNKAIKKDELEGFIKKSDFDPSQLGSYEFVLMPWKEAKEKRKLGDEIQVLIDELFKEGNPTISISTVK